MRKEIVSKPEIKLVGLSVRTNNKNEMNPQTAKISNLTTQFRTQNIPDLIPNRKNPGVVYSIYTEYDSDEFGDYTYFLGEEVDDFEETLTDVQRLIIPPAVYQKFTTDYGRMPDVVIDAWKQIWEMTSDDLGGKRTYQADFEIYDINLHDPTNASLEIYIGINIGER